MIKFQKKRQINIEFGVGEQLDFDALKKKLSFRVIEEMKSMISRARN